MHIDLRIPAMIKKYRLEAEEKAALQANDAKPKPPLTPFRELYEKREQAKRVLAETDPKENVAPPTTRSTGLELDMDLITNRRSFRH